MAIELATAYVSLVPSAKNISANIAKELGGPLDDAAKKSGKSVGDKLMDTAGKYLKRGAIAVGVAAGGVLATALFTGWNRLTAIENATAKLTGLGHSAADVKVIMDNALKSVKGTAFGLDEAATVAASAVAAGVKPGKDLTRTLSLVADASTIAGSSMGEMGAIFNKVATANKVQGDVINQLNDRGIPIIQLLAKSMHKSTDEVLALSKAGKIGFAEFQKAMEEGLGGAALKSGETTVGAFKNMRAALSRFGVALLQGVFPIAKEVFGGINKLLDKASAAVGPFVEKITGKLASGMSKLGTIFAKAKGAFTDFISGLTLKDAASIGVPLEGLVALGYKVRQAFSATVDGVKALVSGFRSGGSQIQQSGFVGVMQQIGENSRRALDFVVAVVKEVVHVFISDLIPAARNVAQWFGPVLVTAVGLVVAAFRVLTSGGVLTVLKSLLDGIGATIRVLSEHLDLLVPAILGVAAAFAAIKAVSAFKTIASGVETLILRLMYLKGSAAAALSKIATPAGAATLAVGLLAAGLSYLYIHSKRAEEAQRKLTAAQIAAVAVTLENVSGIDDLNSRYETSISILMAQVTATAQVSNAVRELAVRADGASQIFADQVAKTYENAKGQKQWQEALQKTKTAQADVNDVVNRVSASMGLSRDTVLDLAIQNGLLEEKSNPLIGTFAGLKDGVDKSQLSLKGFARAAISSADPADIYRHAIDGISDATKNASDKTGDFDRALHGLLDGPMGQQQALVDFKNKVDDLSQSFLANGSTLDINTAAGRRNFGALDSLTQSLLKSAEATIRNGGTVDQASAQFKAQRDILIGQVMPAFGGSRDAAEAYINKLGLVPTLVSTKAEFNDAQAQANLDSLAAKIAGIPREIFVSANFGTIGMNAAIGALMNTPGRASGGSVTAGRPYVVGEHRPELFVPRTSGYIVPNVPAYGQGDGRPVQVTINGNVYGVDDLQTAISGALDKHDRDANLTSRAYRS